jgi:hypothetical protein
MSTVEGCRHPGDLVWCSTPERLPARARQARSRGPAPGGCLGRPVAGWLGAVDVAPCSEGDERGTPISPTAAQREEMRRVLGTSAGERGSSPLLETPGGRAQPYRALQATSMHSPCGVSMAGRGSVRYPSGRSRETDVATGEPSGWRPWSRMRWRSSSVRPVMIQLPTARRPTGCRRHWWSRWCGCRVAGSG